MGGLTETYETMSEDQEPVTPEEPEEKDAIYAVITQPFFGPDKKYGACPICAAVVIAKNEVAMTNCPNCRAELALS